MSSTSIALADPALLCIGPGMIVYPHHVIDALDVNSNEPRVQDLPALCAYVMLRGYAWADSISIGDAIDQIGTGQEIALHQDLGPALLRCLENRARIDGPDWSVADVGRIRWYQRRVESWENTIQSLTGIGWPGEQAWADLRVAHLLRDGWTCKEIASLTGVPARSIKTRANRIGRSLRWAAICPVSTL